MKLTATLLSFIFYVFSAAASAKNSNWISYSSKDAQRYSSLSQIKPSNVQKLKKAWTHSTGEAAINLQATPLVIDGLMYYPSTQNTIFALDATNGKEVWKYVPTKRYKAPYSAARGVSYHQFKTKGVCSARIYSTTADGQLLALDAKSGELCKDFGKEGVVDLHKGMGDVTSRGLLELFYTTPPAIYADTQSDGGFLVIGGSVADNRNYLNSTSGVIRAFDLKSGQLIWDWEPLPDGFRKDSRINTETETYGQYQRGTPNSWSFITTDPESGLIFIPFGTPSPDYFLGYRPDFPYLLKYGSSVVALNAKGKKVWDFKAIRTDVWDYDIPSQPNLIDFKTKNKFTQATETKPAVVVSTKIGHTFILDRMTGEPLVPVTEQPVPLSTVNGEIELAKTQKFPSFPILYDSKQVQASTQINEAWLLELRSKFGESAEAYCRGLFSKSSAAEVFTPPDLDGQIQFPSAVGGNHWGGNSYDPLRKILITNINLQPSFVQLIKRQDQACKDRTTLGYGGIAYDGPYCMRSIFLQAKSENKPIAAFCTPPPWGQVVAFDMESKKELWREAIGQYGEYKGSQSLGGILTTQSGLAFMGATADKTFRAIDTKSGKVLWQHALPAHGAASPMTYSVDCDQYVAIAAGGHYFIDSNPDSFGNEIVAFKLPAQKSKTKAICVK